nr:DMT family transporter [Acinetobacter sp. Marseille-Q1620]
MNKINTYWTGVICGLLAALIWAAFPVMTRFGVARSSFDAWDMTFIRFIFSGLLSIPYLLYSRTRQYKKIPIHGICLMVFGLGAPYMFIIASGLKLAPVEQFAVVTPASMIVFSLFLGLIFLKNKIYINEILGISVIVSGVVLVGYYASSGSNIYSYLLFLIGGMMWAIYTVSSRYYCDSALYATALVSLFSMLLFAPVYLALKGFEIFSVPFNILIPQLIYQGLLVSIVALFFYSKSVFLLGSTAGSVFAALVPALATIISAISLHELPHFYSVIGLIIITIGMILTIVRWENLFPNKK